MEYSKKIERLECYISYEGFEYVVKTVLWSYKVVDAESGLSSQIMDKIDLPISVAPESFINYHDLTEAQVLAWVEANTAQEKLDSLKQLIDENLASKLVPASIATPVLPWEE